MQQRAEHDECGRGPSPPWGELMRAIGGPRDGGDVNHGRGRSPSRPVLVVGREKAVVGVARRLEPASRDALQLGLPGAGDRIDAPSRPLPSAPTAS